VARFVGVFVVGQLALGQAFMPFGSCPRSDRGSDSGWGLCSGSGSGSVRGRIRGGRRGYGAHGRTRRCGGRAVNMDLLGVIVSLQEEK
jgi:hypothetical protein